MKASTEPKPKPRKARYGSGTVRRTTTSTGVHFRASVYLGLLPDGRQNRPNRTFTALKEAQEWIQKTASDANGGTAVDHRRRTMRDVATAYLLHARNKATLGNLKARTLLDYERVNAKIMQLPIAQVFVRKLTIDDVEAAVVAISTVPQCSTSKATFQEGKRALLQLRRLLTFAQQRGWVSQNVAGFLMPAKIPLRKMLIWEPAEVGTFLTVAAAHRMYALFFLALSHGMRVGELMGLHWAAIDEVDRKLHVRHSYDTVNGLGEPKWGSFRTLELTEVTLQVLRSHRGRQQRDRAAAGPAWKEEGLVFPSSVGSYTDHSNVRQVMDRLIRQAGVTRIRVHDMRHTAASTMIQRGDDVVLVADVLGHRDPAMTLRVYSHVSKTHRQARVRDATTLYGLPAPPVEGEWKPTRIRQKVKDADALKEDEPRRKHPSKATGGR